MQRARTGSAASLRYGGHRRPVLEFRQTGVAPLVAGRPMIGRTFAATSEQCLVPALAPGYVVVLDNVAAHKGDGVRQAIAAAGASVLYLPPYSPDLLRKAAALTKEELWSTIAASSTPAPQPSAPTISVTAHTFHVR
jgi:hypothetical protein